jgi:phosphotransferase system HPr (HPr) family protein
MAERRVVVGSKVGLHARPAALLAKLADQQPIPVTIRKNGGEPVLAASVLNLMTLGAMHGDEVVLAAEGDDAEAVLEKVAELVARDLDE